MVLIVAVILVIFLAKHIPKIGRGFGNGLSAFRKACDEQAHEAGRSLGGIHGKPAAQALTPDNRTAELYDPAVFHKEERQRRAKKERLLIILHRVLDWIKKLGRHRKPADSERHRVL